MSNQMCLGQKIPVNRHSVPLTHCRNSFENDPKRVLCSPFQIWLKYFNISRAQKLYVWREVRGVIVSIDLSDVTLKQNFRICLSQKKIVKTVPVTAIFLKLINLILYHYSTY